MMDKEPKLRLFLFSPAQQAVEFVGRAVPAVRPEPKFTDEVPLMQPVLVAAKPLATPGTAGRTATAGAVLLCIAAALLAGARIPAARGTP
jgi:hypothetical protein